MSFWLDLFRPNGFASRRHKMAQGMLRGDHARLYSITQIIDQTMISSNECVAHSTAISTMHGCVTCGGFEGAKTNKAGWMSS